MAITYLSIFSGIEAASAGFEPLGWKCIGLAEVDEFPSSVLAHRMPDTVNVGDVSKVNWHEFCEKYGRPVLLIGGPPCQAFSIAGLRQGLNDPRGNLTLEYLRAVDEVAPEVVVFENVPGIMSDRTHAFETFLEGLQQIGYIIDMDILDAQYFGLAQRRRRVFVLGWRVEGLLRRRTTISRLIVEQMLAKVLQARLEEAYAVSDGMPADCELGDRFFGRLGSYGLLSEDDLTAWLESLAGNRKRLDEELADAQSKFVARLWEILSGNDPDKGKPRIYDCVAGLLLIAKLMPDTMPLMPIFANEGLVVLAALKGFTSYAIRKNERPNLLEGFDDVLDHLSGEASRAADALECLAEGCTREVRAQPESLPRDTQARRTSGEGPATAAGCGAEKGCGGGV